MHHIFLKISLPLYDVKLLNFTFMENVNTRSQLQEKSPTFDNSLNFRHYFQSLTPLYCESRRLEIMSEIQANKLKERSSLKQREFTFLVTFSLPLSSSVLKLPNNMI